MTVERFRPPRQLLLGLPHQPAAGRADLLAGDANRAAIALLDAWPAWPVEGAFLSGPAGSGKTHIVDAWRAASGATVLPAVAVSRAAGGRLGEASGIAVEDLHAGPLDEAALFHLVNLARERRIPLLLTSRAPVAALGLALPDLASRLKSARPVAIAEPDDDLFRRVIAKLFADRQVAVDPAVADYLLVRIERSMAAANAVVARLDEEALAEGRAITRQFAGEVLERLQPSQPDFWPDG